MKKWTKRILKGLVVAVLCLALIEVGLHVISRTEWFTQQVEQMLHRALAREVDLGRMGINFRGIFVEDIQVAQQGGFEKGVFVQAGRLRIRFSLLHLLYGHFKARLIVLSDAQIKLTAHADGTTSWDDLTTSGTGTAPDSTAHSTPLQITAGRVRLENLDLIYVDEQAPRTLQIKGVTLDVKHFSLDKEFPLTVLATLHHQEESFSRKVPLTLKTKVYLNDLDLTKAYVNIDALKAYYQNSTLQIKGKIENLLNPAVELKVILRNFSSDMLAGVADVMPFALAQADGSVKLKADLEKQTLTVHHVSLQAPGVEFTGKGGLVYKDKLHYDASAQIHLVGGEIGRWIPVLADPYHGVGTLQGDFSATQDTIQATLTLDDMGAVLPGAGRMANVNGKIKLEEKMDFKTGSADVDIKGKLNANPFTLALQAQQTPQKILANLDVYAKEVLVPALAQTSSPQEEVAEPVAQDESEQRWPLPPVELKARIKLDQLDAPYFFGKDIEFSSDVAGLTPQLDQAHGTLRLVTGEGKIQDIYKLTNANPLTKVLFLSLNVTGKVFNSLNVFGVLSSLGSGVASVVSGGDKAEAKATKTQTILGPDGEPLEVTVEETDKQVSGEMEYDRFDTEVNFVDGLATIKEGIFVSPMMSFRLDGTADFNTGKLDMKVHAAPGRHELDGMMPLSLKIGGTVEDPQGDMQVLGSMGALVTQSVTNNVVSRNVTKGVKSFFGLFKKKADK